jgi:hypothetical protein
MVGWHNQGIDACGPCPRGVPPASLDALRLAAAAASLAVNYLRLSSAAAFQRLEDALPTGLAALWSAVKAFRI